MKGVCSGRYSREAAEERQEYTGVLGMGEGYRGCRDRSYSTALQVIGLHTRGFKHIGRYCICRPAFGLGQGRPGRLRGCLWIHMGSVGLCANPNRILGRVRG